MATSQCSSPFSVTYLSVRSCRDVRSGRQECVGLTLDVWFQLGELRRFSVGDNSDSGRGIELAIFVGDEVGVSLDNRSGWTCVSHC
jgi:hypothetical protein